MSDFNTYAERISEDYSDDMFLGRVCWYAITESTYVDHTNFCGLLLGHGIEHALPPQPRSADVFKRACTASQRRRVRTADPNFFINYNIREVGKDVDHIWRVLVAEKVDTDGHTLGYEELTEFCYARGTQSIHTTPRGPIEQYPEAQEVVQNVLDTYAAQNNLLTPYAIREFVRRLVRSLNATSLRDGVYFIREDHALKLAALESIINGLPGGSSMHSLPLLDDRKQREMLRKSFEDESVGEIDRFLGDVREIMLKQSTKITSDRFADLKVQYDSLKAKAAEYEELLETSLGETNSRLEVMNQALFSLMGRISERSIR